MEKWTTEDEIQCVLGHAEKKEPLAEQIDYLRLYLFSMCLRTRWADLHPVSIRLRVQERLNQLELRQSQLPLTTDEQSPVRSSVPQNNYVQHESTGVW